jgi:hypothetical protein
MSMVSPDIEPQVMEIWRLLGQRPDESAPPTLPLSTRDVHVGGRRRRYDRLVPVPSGKCFGPFVEQREPKPAGQ